MLRHLRGVGALMVSVMSETLWKGSRDGNSMNQTAKWIETVDLVGTCWNNYDYHSIILLILKSEPVSVSVFAWSRSTWRTKLRLAT